MQWGRAGGGDNPGGGEVPGVSGRGCSGFRGVSWPLGTLEWKRVLEEIGQGTRTLNVGNVFLGG